MEAEGRLRRFGIFVFVVVLIIFVPYFAGKISVYSISGLENEFLFATWCRGFVGLFLLGFAIAFLIYLFRRTFDWIWYGS